MTIKFGVKDASVYDKDRKAMEKKLTQRLSRYFSDEEVEAFVKISGGQKRRQSRNNTSILRVSVKG